MYTAKTTTGQTKTFESMQEAKRFAVKNGNGGTLTDHDLNVCYKVSRHGVCDFFNLKKVKSS